MYNANISENFLEGSTIINIVANDTDAGNNGRLSYSITVLTAGGQDLFRVGGSTGTIISTGTFDRESFAGPYTIAVGVAQVTKIYIKFYPHIVADAGNRQWYPLTTDWHNNCGCAH